MKRAAALLAVCLLAASASADDVLVLENGREARGRIVEENDSGVTLDLGGGRMFYPRRMVKEVRRGAPTPATEGAASSAAKPDGAREEHALLFRDGARAGTRALRASRTPAGGWRFEEEVVLLDEKGAPQTTIRTTEHANESFEPVSFQVRESEAAGGARMVAGEVRGGRIYVSLTRAGERTTKDDALPPGARFPLAARELFLRESVALAGKLEAPVYEPREGRWRPTQYTEGGRKPVASGGRVADLRVVLRKRGETLEREWVDGEFVSHMSELEGETLRAIGSTADVIARMRQGDTERVTGPDSAPRTRYADPERGWRIGKPDPSWTFEEPTVRGAGALLTVRNAGLFATVDVMHDPAAPTGVTIERAAESTQRVCRSVASDFRVVADGWIGEGPSRVHWFEATATTKGERTTTLAHVLVRKGKVYRLLAACPEGAFTALRPELEKILQSFSAD